MSDLTRVIRSQGRLGAKRIRSVKSSLLSGFHKWLVQITCQHSDSLTASCSSFPWACRSSDPSNRWNLLSSDSWFLSKAVFTPNRIFSESFLKNSSFADIVDTVGTVGLLAVIGCHNVVGVTSSTGGVSSDSTSSLDIVQSSDSSSDSITSNLGGLWSTWWASELHAMFVAPSSFWWQGKHLCWLGTGFGAKEGPAIVVAEPGGLSKVIAHLRWQHYSFGLLFISSSRSHLLVQIRAHVVRMASLYSALFICVCITLLFTFSCSRIIRHYSVRVAWE